MSNSNYTKVDNTAVSGSALSSSSFKLALPLANVRVVSGRFYARAAGNYPLQQVAESAPGPDNYVMLSAGDVILGGSMVGVTGPGGAYASAASATYRLGASATTGASFIGGPTGYALGATTSSFVQVATGVSVVLTTSSGVAGHLFPMLQLRAGALNSGAVDANLLVLNVAPAPQA